MVCYTVIVSTLKISDGEVLFISLDCTLFLHVNNVLNIFPPLKPPSAIVEGSFLSVGEIECKILIPLPSSGSIPLFSHEYSWGCHTVEHKLSVLETADW